MLPSRFSLATAGVLLLGLLAPSLPCAIASSSGIDPRAFVEKQKITSDDGATDDQFGWSIAVAGDIALVGAPNATIGANAGQGAVYVFTRVNRAWVQMQKLTASDGQPGDAFGISVSLLGSTAMIGAPDTDTFRGAAYVFYLAGGAWTQRQKLLASDGTEFNQFGWSVAQDGRTVLIGSISATVGVNSSQGAVYSFTRSGGVWSETQKFSSSAGVSGDSFGWSVALDGNTALIGTGFVTVNDNEFQGAAYIFHRNGNGWTEIQKLTADNGNSFDFFGLAVALEGPNALIGAEGAATDGNPFSNQGVVYRFTNSGGSWTQTQIVSASDGQDSDSFGQSVALYGGTAIIGATGVTVNGAAFAGAAYVFETSGGSLIETQKLTASDPAENALYGWSVAIFGRSLFAGAYAAMADGHERQGAVYINRPGPASDSAPP